MKKVEVLLDGGATHNVFYSPKRPEGPNKRKVELAHGAKQGYVKNGDITFIDASVSVQEARTPAIISLGRLIARGSKLDWSEKKAYITFPDGENLKVPIRNYCLNATGGIERSTKGVRGDSITGESARA